MTISNIKELSEEQQNILYKAPALVTVLIGGVDGDFDTNEEARAKRAVHFRQTIGDPLLFEYFAEVEKSFDSHLIAIASQHTGTAEERTATIAKELESLNAILPLLDEKLSHTLLKSLRSLARGVASASGGVLGFGSDDLEQEWVTLPMINY